MSDVTESIPGEVTPPHNKLLRLVLAIPERRLMARALSRLISGFTIFDCGWRTPLGTGLAALRFAIAANKYKEYDWLLITEDDCTVNHEIIRNIYRLLQVNENKVDCFSLSMIGKNWGVRLDRVTFTEGSYIGMQMMIGTQGFLVKMDLIQEIIDMYEKAEWAGAEFDGLLCAWLMKTRRYCYYTYPSLVKHNHALTNRNGQDRVPVLDLQSRHFQLTGLVDWKKPEGKNCYIEWISEDGTPELSIKKGFDSIIDRSGTPNLKFELIDAREKNG